MVSICNFSHRKIIVISLLISLIIYSFINQIFLKNLNTKLNNSLEAIIPDKVSIKLENTVLNENEIEEIFKSDVINEAEKNSKIQEESSFNSLKNINLKWQLEIPKINIIAQIEEGTSKNTMNNFIGHFEETSREDGNIGLAAHNRGYKVNYFKNLKLLEEGDLLIYTYNGKIYEYSVTEKGIIKDTNWSKLEQDNQNKLTLITCVENEPEQRRYVQAIRIEK